MNEIETLKDVLMRRDGLSSDEADEQIKDAKELMHEYLADGDLESAQDICNECFGLEPDYLFDLLD
jgi:hypothetical protein